MTTPLESLSNRIDNLRSNESKWYGFGFLMLGLTALGGAEILNSAIEYHKMNGDAKTALIGGSLTFVSTVMSFREETKLSRQADALEAVKAQAELGLVPSMSAESIESVPSAVNEGARIIAEPSVVA